MTASVLDIFATSTRSSTAFHRDLGFDEDQRFAGAQHGRTRMQHISGCRAQKRRLVLDGDDVLVFAHDRDRGASARVIGQRHDDAGVREPVLLPVLREELLLGFAPACSVIHELDRHRANKGGSSEHVGNQPAFLGSHAL